MAGTRSPNSKAMIRTWSISSSAPMGAFSFLRRTMGRRGFGMRRPAPQSRPLDAGRDIRSARFSPTAALCSPGRAMDRCGSGGSTVESSGFWADGTAGSALRRSAPRAICSPPARSTGLHSFGRSKMVASSRHSKAERAGNRYRIQPEWALCDGRFARWHGMDLAHHRGSGAGRPSRPCRGRASAAFSPNGLQVVTASPQDRTVRLWAATSGRQIAVIASRRPVPKPTRAHRAVFSSDGTQIAVVSGEQDARRPRLPDAARPHRLCP